MRAARTVDVDASTHTRSLSRTDTIATRATTHAHHTRAVGPVTVDTPATPPSRGWCGPVLTWHLRRFCVVRRGSDRVCVVGGGDRRVTTRERGGVRARGSDRVCVVGGGDRRVTTRDDRRDGLRVFCVRRPVGPTAWRRRHYASHHANELIRTHARCLSLLCIARIGPRMDFRIYPWAA